MSKSSCTAAIDNKGILPRSIFDSFSTALVGAACIVFFYGPTSAASDQPPLRIMPLGDSITQGYRASYRRPLWLALQQAGFNVDFVGSMDRGHGGGDDSRDYDRDHEGHWGWRADEVLEHIDEWVIRAEPDVVLLHLGTNDVGVGQGLAETADEIAGIIGQIRAHNPGAHVLLAAIIPVDHERAADRFRQYNAKLAALAKELDTTTSRVVLVDQSAGFDAAADTYDGVHPNADGNRKMAEKWLAGLTLLVQ